MPSDDVPPELIAEALGLYENDGPLDRDPWCFSEHIDSSCDKCVHARLRVCFEAIARFAHDHATREVAKERERLCGLLPDGFNTAKEYDDGIAVLVADLRGGK